jgi:hypothetical protein
VKERKEVREARDGRSCQEERDRQRIEDRGFLVKEKRMAAEFSVDPEGTLPREERALRDVPDRQVLVAEIGMEEVAPARNDRPERGGGEEREKEAREQPARPAGRTTGAGRRRAQRFFSRLPCSIFTA